MGDIDLVGLQQRDLDDLEAVARRIRDAQFCALARPCGCPQTRMHAKADHGFPPLLPIRSPIPCRAFEEDLLCVATSYRRRPPSVSRSTASAVTPMISAPQI